MIVTSLYVGVLGLLLVLLSMRVGLFRMRQKIAVGHAGNHELERRVRAHGNLVEYAPFAMLQLGLLEMFGAAPLLLHLLGASFTLGRLLHAWGMSHRTGPSFGRLSGIVLSWLAIGLMALMLLTEAVLRLHRGG